MNKHVLTGRPTADPEISYFDKDGEQKMMAKFTLASNHMHDKDADFFRCVAFGKKADFVEKYVKKGMHLLITGPERNNNYKDKEGKTVYGTGSRSEQRRIYGDDRGGDGEPAI